jgi:nucleoside-diphosphate-sugar epimerase
LRAKGNRVRILDMVPPDGGVGEGRSGGRTDERIEFVHADMRDQASVVAAAQDVDVIYHLAAAQRMKPQFRTLSEREIFDMNLRGVAHVLSAAQQRHVRKVVFVSSSGVYGVPRSVPCSEEHPTRPLGAYGQSKLAAEQLCLQAIERNLDVTVLRPMSLFGPRMTGVFVMLFEWVRTGRPVYMLGAGENRVQTTSAWDLADACIRAAETPASRGQCLNVGSDPASVPTVHEQVRALIAHACTSSRIVHIPAGFLRTAARALHLAGLSPIVPEHYILADQTFILDISRAQRVLHWQPQHDNVAMTNNAYDWYVGAGEEYRPQPHPVLRLLDRFAPFVSRG